MYDLVEFRHLKYIAAVAEEGNITRAADRLHIAQPSLSKQIKDIEDEIGFSIFIRTRDGVSVTPSGQIIVAYAQEAIVRRSEVVTLAKAVHRGDIPPLRLGISSFINPALLQHLRDSYHEYFPACIVHLSSGSPSHLLQRLEKMTLDGALLTLPIEGHDWVVQYVARNPLVVCMRMDDPLADGHEISKDDLSARLNIFSDPELHPAAHRQLFEMLGEAGIHPEIKCVAATPADIQWMVRTDRGVALVDQSIPLDSDLTTRPIAGIHWTVDAAFVHHVKADHLALPFVVQFARQMTTRRKANQNPAQRPNKPVQLQLLA
jgi:DNA-binding transcriptional LysR family regulator